MHVPAFVLQIFFLILRTVQRSVLPSGVVCIVLRNVITEACNTWGGGASYCQIRTPHCCGKLTILLSNATSTR